VQKSQIPYWIDREEQEIAAFLGAMDPRIREVHQEMAERYADAIRRAQDDDIKADLVD